MSETRFGRKVSDFIKDDVKVNSAGKVTGTLKYVTGYTAFDETTLEHQEGNYFPFKINKQGQTIEAKKNGAVVKTVDFDPDWIIRVENTADTFEFSVDGEHLVTLDFSEVTLLSGVETKVPDATTKVQNKIAKDIQEGIKISNDNKVTGKSLYVKDIEGADGEGNYLVLEFSQAKDPENTVKCQFEGGEETTLSTADYQYLIKLKEKKPITVTITGKVNTTRKLDISEVILMQPMNEVITVLDQNHDMGNKKVSVLQTDVEISEEGKITGTSNYVTDLQLSTGKKEDGNYICLHLATTKLPKGTITLGINNMVNADDDVLLKVTKESKLKPFKIAVDGKVLYKYDLSELVIEP